mgnify:CR=1 FL=1
MPGAVVRLRAEILQLIGARGSPWLELRVSGGWEWFCRVRIAIACLPIRGVGHRTGSCTGLAPREALSMVERRRRIPGREGYAHDTGLLPGDTPWGASGGCGRNGWRTAERRMASAHKGDLSYAETNQVSIPSWMNTLEGQ